MSVQSGYPSSFGFMILLLCVQNLGVNYRLEDKFKQILGFGFFLTESESFLVFVSFSKFPAVVVLPSSVLNATSPKDSPGDPVPCDLGVPTRRSWTHVDLTRRSSPLGSYCTGLLRSTEFRYS